MLFFYYCGIPIVLLILAIIESVKLYQRTLRPVQVVVTSAICLVVYVGTFWLWLFSGIISDVQAYPDAISNLPFVIECFTFAADLL